MPRKPAPRPIPKDIDLAEDAKPISDKIPSDLSSITNLAVKALALQARIEKGQALLAELSGELTKILTVDLPDAMTELGMSEFSLNTGEKIKVSPVVAASLPSESSIEKTRDEDAREALRLRFERGIAFLTKNGAESLIKTKITANFGKGESSLAKKAIAALKKLAIPASVGKSVHPSTLTAWVKERLAEGKEVDHEALSVYTGNKAEIKIPGASKGKKDSSGLL